MAIPVSLAITAGSLRARIGLSVQLTARVTYDNATTADVTAQCVWTSSNPSVATVAAGLVSGVALGAVTISASYSESGAVVKTTVASDDFNRADETLTSGNWEKPSAYATAVSLVGQRLRAPAAWSGQKAGANWKTPMTSSHQWARLAVPVSQDGTNTSGYKGVRVRSNQAGDTYYFVGLNNTVDGVLHLGKCVAGTVTVWSGANPTCAPGHNFELEVIDNGDGTSTLKVYVDGVYTGLTHTDGSIQTGNYIGVHLEGQVGNTTYYYLDDFAGGDWRAATTTVTTSTAFTIYERVLESLTLTPDAFTIRKGNTQQLTCTAYYDDDSFENCTAASVWSSSDESVASSNAVGLVSAIERGAASITATYGGLSAIASVVVTTATVVTKPGGTYFPPLHWFSGQVSNVEVDRLQSTITVVSDLYVLDVKMPRNVMQPSCRHQIYEAGCDVVKANFANPSSIGAGSTKLIVTVAGGVFDNDGYFEQGVIEFTTGANAGLKRTIKEHRGGKFFFHVALPFDVQTGDQFVAYPGCDKTLAMCAARFDNRLNFGGEPFIPVPETIL